MGAEERLRWPGGRRGEEKEKEDKNRKADVEEVGN